MSNYFKNTWRGLWTVLIGLKITFSHLFTRSVTIQYPEIKVPLPERARNRLYVNMNDCIGCYQCARACPVNCIDIETVKSIPGEDLGKTSQGKKKALWVTNFTIDFAKCCYCGLCTYPCPTNCIYFTETYEYSEWEREKLIYQFSTLTKKEIEEKKMNFMKIEQEKDSRRTDATKGNESERKD